MAQVSSIVKKASILAVVALSAAVTVSAQSISPAPSPDAGAAFSIPVSGVVIGSSMLLSFVALANIESCGSLSGCTQEVCYFGKANANR
ncbi:hypothetical protein Ccrd_003203 [Cynara cardunculus var. scolymus]|uniref:Uncharacterized protein n=1 Tax=Cynara cardunculus var. scolymus TaxID=59895 RepID=A0A103XPW2_CYNCS|nr:hypothetical protein Ccrd_003203 [Cynara cardunculus var. scolymus]